MSVDRACASARATPSCAEDDFGGVLGRTAATVGEFVRDETGSWDFHSGVQGFEDDPSTFTREMGRSRQS